MTKGKPWTYATLWGGAIPTNQFTTPQANGECLNHFVTFNKSGFVVGIGYCQNANEKANSSVGFLADVLNGGLSIVRAVALKRPPSWNSPPAAKWQYAYFRPRFPVVAGQTIRFGVVHSAKYGYMYNSGALLASDFATPSMTLPQDTAARHNGLKTSSTLVELMLSNTADGGHMFGIDLIFWDGVN